MLDMKHLWEYSGAAGWNGPYYSGSIDTDSARQGRVDHPLYDWFTVDMAPDLSFDYSSDVGGCSAAANAVRVVCSGLFGIKCHLHLV